MGNGLNKDSDKIEGIYVQLCVTGKDQVKSRFVGYNRDKYKIKQCKTFNE